MPPLLPFDARSAELPAPLRFLYQRVDYERMQSIPYEDHHFKLGRMRELLARLGSPERGVPIVHVAGTKGKGSTSAMIAAVLTAAGFRTGLYTSPHLDRLEERMSVDGRPCPAARLVEILAEIQPVVEAMDRQVEPVDPTGNRATFFEITTAAALLDFARQKVAAAVLEVGLGGRLDSTNVCQPRVSVITSISFDHTRQLGNTLEAIAREKAGIIKPGVPVVSGVCGDGPRAVIRDACQRQQCRLVEIGREFRAAYVPPTHLEQAPGKARFDYFQPAVAAAPALADVELSLLGRHQAANAAVALATLGELQAAGWNIPQLAIRAGLSGLAWPARVEVLSRRPTVVIDAAHNAASVAALLETLAESFAARRRILVFATTRDKDLRGMLQQLLPAFDHVLLTLYAMNPRAVPAEELAQLAQDLTGRPYPPYADAAAAYVEARRLATPDDLICVAGSFFIAAEIRRMLPVSAVGG